MTESLVFIVKVIRYERGAGEIVNQEWRKQVASPHLIPRLGDLIDFDEIGELVVGKSSISLDCRSVKVTIVITLDEPPGTSHGSWAVNRFGGGDPDELSNALSKSGFIAGAAICRPNSGARDDSLAYALSKRAPAAAS